MGYTHYFPQQRAFTDEEWERIQNLAARMFEGSPVPLGDVWGNAGPVISWQRVSFNGHGEEDAHEPFVVTREYNPEYNFCKTAEKPYDLVVVGMLTMIEAKAPGALTIGSDGNVDDWEEGVTWVNELLNEQYTPPPGVRS